MRAMRADIEALALQVNKLDARLAATRSDDAEVARLHALRESIKGEVSELEVLITGKQQLQESMALLNKHKTNDFRTSMLMKWSRSAGGGAGADGEGGAGAGGFTPRTMAKKQSELKQLQGDKKILSSELRDCDDQLEQIELEKARLEAEEDDPDISEALDELREQLNHSKKEKLSQMQLMEQAESNLAAELGVSTAVDDVPAAVATGGGGGGAAAPARGGGGGARSHDPAMQKFAKGMAALWKKLEASSIEKLNVGQQEVLGVKDLLRLSNEQIDSVVSETKRMGPSKASDAIDAEMSSLVYDLLLDTSGCRRRLNDYTEGLLVQTAQKLDIFKAAYEASRGEG